MSKPKNKEWNIAIPQNLNGLIPGNIETLLDLRVNIADGEFIIARVEAWKEGEAFVSNSETPWECVGARKLRRSFLEMLPSGKTKKNWYSIEFEKGNAVASILGDGK